MKSKQIDLSVGTKTIETVGELKSALANLPDETPIVRLTDGVYQVKMDDVGFFYGMIEQDERKMDRFDCKTLLISM